MAERKSKKDHPGDTKKQIQEIATQLFNELGYEETTIPMICERAGVSKTTLHYYFPRKQDLFEDMYNSFEAMYVENFHRIVEQETFTRQIWEVFCLMCEGDLFYGPSACRHYFTQRMQIHDQRDFIKNIYHRKILVPIIRAAQRTGQMQNMTDADTICETISFAMRGIIITWAIEDGTIDLMEQARILVRSIILPNEGYDI